MYLFRLGKLVKSYFNLLGKNIKCIDYGKTEILHHGYVTIIF